MNQLYRYFVCGLGMTTPLLHLALAQSNPLHTTLIVETEYRNNIVRSLDSLKLNDMRINIDLSSRYQLRLPRPFQVELSSKILSYFYSKYTEYNRYDYFFRFASNISLINNIKLNINNNFRYRNYPNYTIWKFARNIYELNIVFPIFLKPTVGYQGWTKTYPATNQISDYHSQRWFLKISKASGGTGFTMKYDTQDHRGNLYPNTSLGIYPNYLKGKRRTMLLSLDQLIGENLFMEFQGRFEDDISDGPNYEGSDDEQDNDEDIDDLLEEDSDFNYRKFQVSMSLFYQLNSRISLLSFNVYQNKRFKNWTLANSAERRRDLILYSTNVIIVKLSDRFSIDLKYILERNKTNVMYFNYQGHSLLMGILYTR